MKPLNLLALLIVFSGLVACGSYPTSNVSQGDARPTLVFQTSNRTADVILDGNVMGKAYQFRGKPYSLIIEEGAHTLQVVDNGNVLLVEKIFVSGGQTKTIEVDL